MHDSTTHDEQQRIQISQAAAAALAALDTVEEAIWSDRTPDEDHAFITVREVLDRWL